MQTINWQENGFFEEEQDNPSSQDQLHNSNNNMGVKENQDIEIMQLSKYQDPSQDKHRQAYISVLEKFSILLSNQDLHTIAKDLLTEDVEVFIFSSSGRAPVRDVKGPDGFINLYKDNQIKERRVREIYVDVEKSTACQICNYSITYPDSNSPEEEVASEVFTISGERISKYRAFFGRPVYNAEYLEDPLEPTKKDEMLAKVKEINCALAGQPDFEKAASLLHENFEYRIWRWDDCKGLVLSKNNFVSSFATLQENLVITSVVPYELYSDPQAKFIASTYVYHLEEKLSGKKFIWLSTCAYGFDGNLHVIKVNQQGELHPEGEVDIPFETFTREKLVQLLSLFYWRIESGLDLMYSDKVLYDCTVWDFVFAGIPNQGPYKGLKHIEKVMAGRDICQNAQPDFVRVIDAFVDTNYKSHDIAFCLLYSHGPCYIDGVVLKDKTIDCIAFARMAFENGKIAKVLDFVCLVPEQIPTPFDDKTFHCTNLK